MLGVTELFREVRYLWRPCIVCTAIPLPLLLFVHSPIGRGYALMLFFVGTMGVVAYSFRRDIDSGPGAVPEPSLVTALWRRRIAALAHGLIPPLVAFTLASVLVNNPYNYGTPQGVADEGIWWQAFVFDVPRDFAAPLLAMGAVVTAICIVPYLVLTTRKAFAAVVFGAALVGLMKLIGCLIVVLIYGWDSDVQGRLSLPWNNPDLLVWLFLGFTASLSVSFYVLGRRRFVQQYDQSAALDSRRLLDGNDPVVLGI